ncbi:MAG: ABC transporter permease [Acidobacteria bacterium]|nr:ABC transporter permease [Acidobacteriota bacterium]
MLRVRSAVVETMAGQVLDVRLFNFLKEFSMFTNFLRVTLRTLYREKVYAAINIVGLSIAIACCVIIGLWLHGELTYDQHNSKYKQIYLIENEFSWGPEVIPAANSSDLFGPILARDYPVIKGYAQIGSPGRILLNIKDKSFYSDKVYNADNRWFGLFDHKIIYGDPKKALTEPDTAAVSESFAKKYFGDENPIGETIKPITGPPRKIVLVFADLPENSHLRYDVLFSHEMEKIPEKLERNQAFFYPGPYTFLLMPEDYNIDDFNKISESFNKRYLEGERRQELKHWLLPLADVHYCSHTEEPTGNIFYLYGFTGVGIFILLVACINYMNLSTARFAKRAKEVGMRKILGSGKIFLILQFLGEAIFFSIISMFIGLVLVELALDFTPVNQLLEKTLSLDLINRPELLGWIVMFSLALGVIAGIHPALYLSSILPLSVLITGVKADKGNIHLRQILVMIQFVISTGIIACTLIMALQMRYCSTKSLGFNKENRVVISLLGVDLAEKAPLIKKEIAKNNHVLGSTFCDSDMAGNILNGYQYIENSDKVRENKRFDMIEIDNDFIKVMGLKMVSGRNFSGAPVVGAGVSLIVNETLVKEQGWDQPLGKNIENRKVIGVVKDFHPRSFHQKVKPLIFQQYSRDNQYNFGLAPEMFIHYLIVNIDGEDMPQTITFLEKIMEEFDPRNAFEFKFLDDALEQMYWSEQKAMKLVGTFSTICIFISCLGLFGLAAFTTEQRTKEIGIRKVLGASTWQLIIMLARNILIFILLGGIIASLAAYFTMDEWLTSFAYKIDIEPWMFLVSILIVAAVAFITIALQSFKTAQTDPVKALRYE